jgi:large subunit ribosomal protein L31
MSGPRSVLFTVRVGTFWTLKVPSVKEESSLKQIHPELTLTSVRCTSCGSTFTTRSTRSELVVDTCSNCHPAYTGRERVSSSGSRIARFERRRQKARSL